MSAAAATPSLVTRPIDLQIEWRLDWTIVADLGASQEIKAGWACTFNGGVKRRRLCIGMEPGTVKAFLEDETPVRLGGNFTPAGTTLYGRIIRKNQGDFVWQLRSSASDPWTTQWVENIADPHIVMTELFVQGIGPASPAVNIKFEFDFLSRPIGVPVTGSTADVSYAFGTVVDDSFLEYLDLMKPSGLKITIQEI